MSTKKALLIGINYTGTVNKLRGCINDVQNISSILTTNCGYLPANVRLLSDPEGVSVPVNLPTVANIKNGIQWLVSNNAPGTTLVFYYAGHGASIKDTSGDETDGLDEVIVPLDYKKAGILTDDWLFTNMVAKVTTGVNMWVFTDCCHSGTMVDLKYNCQSMCTLINPIPSPTSYNQTAWTEKFNITIERNKYTVQGNVYLMSGCKDSEKSVDAFLNAKFQGAFTSCLIACMKANMITDVVSKKTILPHGKLKLRNVLKEVNARLILNRYTGQNSQLSVDKLENLERTLDI